MAPTTYRPSVEVFSHTEHHGLALWDALDLVAPFPRDLEGSLDSLGTGVHREHHVEAEIVRHKLGKAREDIVVKGSRREC